MIGASVNPLRISAATASCLLILAAMPPSSAAPLDLAGRYCGIAWSGGEIVEVVTTFTIEAGGLLAGRYEFADQGEMTPGTLREYWKLSDSNRTLIWTDKYGIGQLVLEFDAGGASFTGKWGADLWAPTLQWDGHRCDTTVQRRLDRHAVAEVS